MTEFDLGAAIRQTIAEKQRRDLAALRPEEPETPAADPPRVNAGAGSDDKPTSTPTFDDNLRALINPDGR